MQCMHRGLLIFDLYVKLSGLEVLAFGFCVCTYVVYEVELSTRAGTYACIICIYGKMFDTLKLK